MKSKPKKKTMTTIKPFLQHFREFVMAQKLEYEKRGLIPTLNLLIEDLDSMIDEPDRGEDDNEASREIIPEA